ncbi:MAG: hypothetical protein JNM72_08680 [Deltaproteobacteria bacterium]|nr:hypothetical protein [Deltaproteobacteria bacterium]
MGSVRPGEAGAGASVAQGWPLSVRIAGWSSARHRPARVGCYAAAAAPGGAAGAPLSPLVHLILAVGVAVLAPRLPRGGRWPLIAPLALGFAALAALPHPLGPTLGGTEGVGEALTVGLLLAIAARGWSALRWISGAALLLVGEELDWLQPLLGYPTPPVLAALGSRTTAANVHNLPVLGGLWRVVPLAGLLLSCLKRHPKLPPLSKWTGAVALVLFAALIAGGGKARALDEAVELGLVLAVWLGWERRGSPGVEAAAAPPPARAAASVAAPE